MDIILFVEGESDKGFMQAVLRHMKLKADVQIVEGGVSKLHLVKFLMDRGHEAGKIVGVVLDADGSFSEKRAQVDKAKQEIPLPVDHYFLVPNHGDSGCLETLLERISIPRHRHIYECFENYEDCVRNASSEYVTPDMKAKIYAYCEALGIETNPNKRDYNDAAHWDLDSCHLDPLKTFLAKLAP